MSMPGFEPKAQQEAHLFPRYSQACDGILNGDTGRKTQNREECTANTKTPS